ncbi:Radical SAM domain protein [Salinarchaeum sp. Harcht-Bsk1]|uniref:TIGR04053 family radical SAM/SPASM domain-containing protein n=1 Tax=Salinarchaeum sp. Harcht-Bsk1 TaxID=1333523 RepID=UPI000342470E|nr:TIGR04053 family radical SAM/SPASM domain-containing protein [Salinarchaeum sp. Harcht-Bsk1]AGN02778.1 Radical SAM domain protein [Salinarchaeum sp. Harcht-Bsk1]
MRPSSLDTDQRPFVLIWELTQACELACDHCRAEAQAERHPDELTTAEGKELLEQARGFGDGQLVVLSGGDPAARPDLIELVEYGTDLGLSMTVTPSGTASLTRDVIDDLADAGIRRLALSIDGGFALDHDAFRGEEGSFVATLEAASYASEAGIPLQVNTTVCARTVDQLPAIRDLVADLGAALWSVFFLVPVGRGELLDPVSPERAEEVMEWLHEVSREESFGVKTTEAPHYRRVAMQTRRAQDETGGGPSRDGTDGMERSDSGSPGRRSGIVAGDGFAFVSHTGEVYPSGFLPESAGVVPEESIVDVYRDADLFERLRDRSELRGKCGVCEFKHVCGGSRSRAFATTGDPFAADPLCPYVPEGYDGPMPGSGATPPAD